MINFKSKIFVAGHKGLVGSANSKKTQRKKYKNILTASRNKLDLTNQNEVFKYLNKNKPNFIFIAKWWNILK